MYRLEINKEHLVNKRVWADKKKYILFFLTGVKFQERSISFIE